MERIFKSHADLYELYINQKLSMSEIGRQFGSSHMAVSRGLKRFNIPTKTSPETCSANSVNLSNYALNFIYGELLGDMSITNYSNSAACISYTSKYFDYILWLDKILSEFGIGRVGELREHHNWRGTKEYHYISKRYPELLDIRKMFYPNGKKIIPNIAFTPLVLRQWYIGDGTLARTPRPYENPYMKIAACAFPSDDVTKAVAKINNLGIRAKHHANNIIYISTKSAPDFLEYIGSCPVDCYQYKWALS